MAQENQTGALYQSRGVGWGRNAGEGVEKREPSYTVGGNAN